MLSSLDNHYSFPLVSMECVQSEQLEVWELLNLWCELRHFLLFSITGFVQACYKFCSNCVCVCFVLFCWHCQDGSILENVPPLSLVDAVTYEGLGSKGALTSRSDSITTLKRQDSTGITSAQEISGWLCKITYKWVWERLFSSSSWWMQRWPTILAYCHAHCQGCSINCRAWYSTAL